VPQRSNEAVSKPSSLSGGTEGSNPLPSSAESGANLNFGIDDLHCLKVAIAAPAPTKENLSLASMCVDQKSRDFSILSP
jgi:hypothetical protein